MSVTTSPMLKNVGLHNIGELFSICSLQLNRKVTYHQQWSRRYPHSPYSSETDEIQTLSLPTVEQTRSKLSPYQQWNRQNPNSLLTSSGTDKIQTVSLPVVEQTRSKLSSYQQWNRSDPNSLLHWQ